MSSNETTTVVLTLTGEPSRSKQAGPCWIRIGEIYATQKGRMVPAETGAELTVEAKCAVRRGAGSDVSTDRWTVVVTGDPADTVDVTLGSPQSVDAMITGVRDIVDREAVQAAASVDVPGQVIEGSYTAEQMIAIGGNEWAKKGYRVYLDWIKFADVEVTRYNTGNVSSVYFDGERISNRQAEPLVRFDAKVWWEDGSLHDTFTGPLAERARAMYQSGIAAAVASLPPSYHDS